MKFSLSQIVKNKVFLFSLAVLVVIGILAALYYHKETFIGIDSDVLKNIGLFGVEGETVEPQFSVSEMIVPANEDCEKPPSFTEQQKFLAQKVEQLTSNDLIPESEDFVLDNNYLISGFQHGSDSRVAKNANQQLRADPMIPVIPNLTPFNQPVVDSQDTLRKPLE